MDLTGNLKNKCDKEIQCHGMEVAEYVGNEWRIVLESYLSFVWDVI